MSSERSLRPAPSKRAFVMLSLLAALAAAVFLFLRARSHEPSAPAAPAPSQATPLRIVSLAPSITETLFALGAGPQVVGISTYCHFPPEVEGLPRAGTAITPTYEAIARLEPTLIVASEVGGEQLAPLSRIAKTETLPWLGLDEVVTSTARLGELVGRAKEGHELSNELRTRLSVRPPPNAPRVLLTMSYGDTGGADIWFIRDNSLHGAALRAAGGFNAVASEVRGQPRMSVEELVRLDPDQIIVLVDTELGAAGDAEPFRRITPLRAVQQGRVGVVRVKGALDGGPRILNLISPLGEEIRRLHALR